MAADDLVDNQAHDLLNEIRGQSVASGQLCKALHLDSFACAIQGRKPQLFFELTNFRSQFETVGEQREQLFVDCINAFA